MIRFYVVVREPGKLKPEYFLEFAAPSLPREGDYLSIQRPDHPEPLGEDMIVRKVWWRLSHAEPSDFMSVETNDRKLGKVNEIFVECEAAIGPYSADRRREVLEAKGAPHLEVSRLSVRESDIPNGNAPPETSE